jgi:phosphoribosyl 1,2-cyclic phosphate phosphodiesterase
MHAKLTILGCGGSAGVPSIGNRWGDCDEREPKNRRLRASVAVQTAQTTLVIDTGPDFRVQFDRAGLSRLDAALYTHTHSDHVYGIDELRPLAFYQGAPIPLYGSAETMKELQARFAYLFQGGANLKYYPPVVKPVTLEHGQSYTVGDIPFTIFAQDHSTCISTGYRFGDCAYCTDMLDLDAEALAILKGVRTWVVDAAGYKHKDDGPHANLERIYALNETIGAETIYLTSMPPSMDYQTVLAETPPGYAPAYDGLVLAIEL